MAIASRDGLKEYCLRALGKPVIEINVSDEQVEERIDDALQYFGEYHFDGIERTIYKHTMTQPETDQALTEGYFEIPIPANIFSVLKVHSLYENFSANFFNIKYQSVLRNINEWGRIDLPQYDMTKQHYSLLQFMLDPETRYEFQRVKSQMRIYTTAEGFGPNQTILLEVYRILDPETHTRIYDNRLLKQYTTALIKRQWGANLSKFDGVQLLGGVTMNGSQIYEQANSEIERLEERMLKEHSDPFGFMIG